MIAADASLHNIVEVADDAPAYIPPVGMTLRAPTPDDEQAASLRPGYEPPPK